MVRRDVEVGNVVAGVGRAFDGRAVDAVLDDDRLERRTRGDGLADDDVSPRER
jgi:hypothetical protein